MSDAEPDPILVTGAHRSGTTWVGKTLVQDRDSAYIHEPFNINGPAGIRIPGLDHWYHRVSAEDEEEIERHLRRLLHFRFPIKAALRDSDSIRDVLRTCRDAARFSYHRFRNARPILKDPLAVFSAPWIADTFRADVLILVRHPAAFAGSLKVHGWDHPFSHFTEQESLIEGPLKRWAPQLERAADEPPDVVAQAILIWNCVYSFLADIGQDREHWTVVRLEDIAQRPRASFESLFGTLDLQFSEEVEEHIRLHTDSSNPVTTEANPADIRRDSQSVIWSWMDRLTEEEQRRVRKGTHGVASNFYDESDWSMDSESDRSVEDET